MVAVVNSLGMMAVALILWATVCNGKSLYDEIDPNASEGIAEAKRPSSSFYAGSRYGRSQYTGPTSNNIRIMPRRDFHFLRYGKRANYHEESDATIKCFDPYRGYPLICAYAGVRDYMRCWKGQDMKMDDLEDQSISAMVDDSKVQQQLI